MPSDRQFNCNKKNLGQAVRDFFFFKDLSAKPHHPLNAKRSGRSPLPLAFSPFKEAILRIAWNGGRTWVPGGAVRADSSKEDQGQGHGKLPASPGARGLLWRRCRLPPAYHGPSEGQGVRFAAAGIMLPPVGQSAYTLRPLTLRAIYLRTAAKRRWEPLDGDRARRISDPARGMPLPCGKLGRPQTH